MKPKKSTAGISEKSNAEKLGFKPEGIFQFAMGNKDDLDNQLIYDIADEPLVAEIGKNNKKTLDVFFTNEINPTTNPLLYYLDPKNNNDIV